MAEQTTPDKENIDFQSPNSDGFAAQGDDWSVGDPEASVSAQSNVAPMQSKLTEDAKPEPKGLGEMFPDKDEQNTLLVILNSYLDKKDRQPYLNALSAYSTVETEKAKGLSLQSRLGFFEKSEEYKDSGVNTELSKIFQSEKSQQVRNDSRAATPKPFNSLAESSTGLNQSEADASLAASKQAVDGLGAVAGGVASGMASLAHGVKSLFNGKDDPLAGPLDGAFKNIASAAKEKVCSFTLDLLENAAKNKAEKTQENLAKGVQKVLDLPSDASKEEVEKELKGVAKMTAEANNASRSYAKLGADNLLDPSLTDKQHRGLRSESEVTETAQDNAQNVSDTLSKLKDAPALQGEDKKALKEKAESMANEAAKMVRKMIESIRNMFGQDKRAKAEGEEMEAPAASSGPRPGM